MGTPVAARSAMCRATRSPQVAEPLEAPGGPLIAGPVPGRAPRVDHTRVEACVVEAERQAGPGGQQDVRLVAVAPLPACGDGDALDVVVATSAFGMGID